MVVIYSSSNHNSHVILWEPYIIGVYMATFIRIQIPFLWLRLWMNYKWSASPARLLGWAGAARAAAARGLAFAHAGLSVWVRRACVPVGVRVCDWLLVLCGCRWVWMPVRRSHLASSLCALSLRPTSTWAGAFRLNETNKMRFILMDEAKRLSNYEKIQLYYY